MVSYSSTVMFTEFSISIAASSGPKRLLSGRLQTLRRFIGLAIRPHLRSMRKS
jgi:hypothetical protein